jgi:hypothetical protein
LQTDPGLLNFFSANGGQRSNRKCALPIEEIAREGAAFNEFTPQHLREILHDFILTTDSGLT